MGAFKFGFAGSTSRISAAGPAYRETVARAESRGLGVSEYAAQEAARIRAERGEDNIVPIEVRLRAIAAESAAVNGLALVAHAKQPVMEYAA